METLQGILEINKTRTKSAIRSKLFKSDKAGELLALYRLICTNEERQMLNQQYIDHTTGGKDLLKTIPDAELDKRIADLEKKFK